MKRKIILLLMAMILLLGMVTPAYADRYSYKNYLSLGDSIAVGTPNPDLGYFAQLEETPNLFKNSINLAIDGMDSKDMLRALWFNRTLRLKVKNADVITLSIGWNDLLGRIMDSAIEYGESHYSDFPPDPPETYQEKLEYFGMLALLIDANELDTIIANAELPRGALEFILRYPNIIRTIKSLNPDAEIYLLNLYNPFPLAGNDYGPLLEDILKPMNRTIAYMSKRYDKVELINVHGKFQTELLNISTPPPVLFNPLDDPPLMDPHPTIYGHLLIYALILEEMGINP